MDRCVRGWVSVHPHVLDDFVTNKVSEVDIHEFIRHVGTEKWILLCDLRQYWLEVVVIYETQMPRVNGMK